jgi:hypothetical protein
MADNATSSFEKMGDSIPDTIVNISGQKVPYTTAVGKQGFGKNSNPDLGSKANRGRSQIHGANGPRCRVVETIAYPNNAEDSGKTYRNVKRVRGGSQFYGARAAAGNSAGD